MYMYMYFLEIKLGYKKTIYERRWKVLGFRYLNQLLINTLSTFFILATDMITNMYKSILKCHS